MDTTIEKAGNIRLENKSEEWEQLGFFTGNLMNFEDIDEQYNKTNKTEGELYLETVKSDLEIEDIQLDKDVTDALFDVTEFIDRQSEAYNELNNIPQDFSDSFEL